MKCVDSYCHYTSCATYRKVIPPPGPLTCKPAHLSLTVCPFIRSIIHVSSESDQTATDISPELRLDYGGLGLTWQNCNISAIYHGI